MVCRPLPEVEALWKLWWEAELERPQRRGRELGQAPEQVEEERTGPRRLVGSSVVLVIEEQEVGELVRAPAPAPPLPLRSRAVR